MTTEVARRRMTLRQLLTHFEKSARDLAEHLQSGLLPCQQDFRELSRPVRRRSRYPTLLALHNALQRLRQGEAEAGALAEHLGELLHEIRAHAKRERVNRR